jgi:hypothetical protein
MLTSIFDVYTKLYKHKHNKRVRSIKTQVELKLDK